MATDKAIAVIDPSEIPEHLRGRGRRDRNLAAISGISGGGAPSIRVKNGRFRIKSGGSDEVTISAKELADGQYLPVAILGIREQVSKVYYAKPYDPNQDDALPPDCFSFDGKAPDASIKDPINTSCAGCPMNAFNTGRNQAGQPTKGKACSDNKIMAVLYRNKVYSLKVPPASLRGLKSYVEELQRHDLDWGQVITFIGLDDSADYGVLTFRVGKYLPDEIIEKLDAMAESLEVNEIMNPTPYVKALPSPDPAPEKPATKQVKHEEAVYEEEKSAKKASPKKAAKVEEPKEEEAKDTPSPALPSDDEISRLFDM